MFAATGGVLGAAVALIAHFVSHTVASTYYVGMSLPDGPGIATATSATPLVHPSWWPMLPAAVAIGLVVGSAVGLLGRSAGLRIVRRSEHTEPSA